MYNSYYFDRYKGRFNHHWIRKFASPQLKYTKLLPEWVKTRNPCVVADLACGTGDFLNRFEDKYPNTYCIGIDASDSLEPCRNNVTFIRADIHKTPLPDNTVDLIIINHVIEHLENPALVLQEIFRILKSGGYVYSETPSVKSTCWWSPVTFWDDPTHRRPYSKIALEELFRNAGIKLQSCGTKHSVLMIFLALPWGVLTIFGKRSLYGVLFWNYLLGANLFYIGRKPEEEDIIRQTDEP